MYPEHITQYEISLMNFESGVIETRAEHVVWNINVIPIKGELKFIE